MALPHGGYGDSAQPFMVLPTKILCSICRSIGFFRCALKHTAGVDFVTQVLAQAAKASSSPATPMIAITRFML
jgi:hypothetical protein